MGNFSVAWLCASLIISAIGYVLLVYGRKMTRTPQFVTGMVLLIYPYFVPSLLPMLIIAGVLLAALWLAVRLGW